MPDPARPESRRGWKRSRRWSCRSSRLVAGGTAACASLPDQKPAEFRTQAKLLQQESYGRASGVPLPVWSFRKPADAAAPGVVVLRGVSRSLAARAGMRLRAGSCSTSRIASGSYFGPHEANRWASAANLAHPYLVEQFLKRLVPGAAAGGSRAVVSFSPAFRGGESSDQSPLEAIRTCCCRSRSRSYASDDTLVRRSRGISGGSCGRIRHGSI